MPIPSLCVRHEVPACRPAEPIFAFGDVHGRLPQLRKSLAMAAELLESGAVKRAACLGDVIDRGEHSRECLKEIAGFRKLYPLDLMLGNHEMFLFGSHLCDTQEARDQAVYNWMRNKGTWALPWLETIVSKLEDLGLGLDSWKSSVLNGNVILVHAGLSNGLKGEAIDNFLAKPKIDIPFGRPSDSYPHWAWIREGFVEFDEPIENRYVVHGHTAREFTGVPKRGRVNLDSSKLNANCGAVIGDGFIEMSVFE